MLQLLGLVLLSNLSAEVVLQLSGPWDLITSAGDAMNLGRTSRTHGLSDLPRSVRNTAMADQNLSPVVLPCALPVGGRIRHFMAEWEKITSDRWVLETVSQGLTMTFSGSLPPLTIVPKQVVLPKHPEKRKALLEAVKDLQAKAAVEVCHTVEPAFFAHVFVLPEKCG